ncbi:MAG: hypothetical protein D6725_03160 [Planctomycetota bacterium]|nr:MAG: hypothetical protein D6725_03160 [Planctomycetota bacterium]
MSKDSEQPEQPRESHAEQPAGDSEPVLDPDELVEVYSDTNVGDAELIRAVLESNGIRAIVEGDVQGFVGAVPVRVLVRVRDADHARRIIESHNRSE